MVGKGGRYVVGMWSVRGRYVVGKVDRVVGMWLVDDLPTTYRQFNLFHITVLVAVSSLVVDGLGGA